MGGECSHHCIIPALLYLADEAIGQVGQWIFYKNEQDNCFIIQHIDKVQFYCRKEGDNLLRSLLV